MTGTLRLNSIVRKSAASVGLAALVLLGGCSGLVDRRDENKGIQYDRLTPPLGSKVELHARSVAVPRPTAPGPAG